jgi:hypothetical protein
MTQAEKIQLLRAEVLDLLAREGRPGPGNGYSSKLLRKLARLSDKAGEKRAACDYRLAARIAADREADEGSTL